MARGSAGGAAFGSEPKTSRTIRSMSAVAKSPTTARAQFPATKYRR
jgi:hypothetical protein